MSDTANMTSTELKERATDMVMDPNAPGLGYEELFDLAGQVERLQRDRDALLAACKNAYEIIDVFLADQSSASDPRCGLVQPVTVADCNELGRVFNLLNVVIAQAEATTPKRENAS